MYTLFLLIIILLICSCIFLAKELLNKFRFWKNFQKDYKNQISWKYNGDKSPGIYTFQMKGMKKFSGLIGFEFSGGFIKNAGYDVFGYIESDENGRVIFSAYLGKGGVEFIFPIEGEDSDNITITCEGSTTDKGK